MAKSVGIKKYKWDIAISLCKQDIDFAEKLVKAINPSLKVFFYKDRQEELIGKSGPEAFAKTFKEESRIVVILSRDEWSETFYTDIERNAIIDRTSVKNEGYQFLMVIPMMQSEIPPWYPSTKIYASLRFTIEELAHFIEFKVADEGGIVKTLTVEDRYQNFKDRVELKRTIVNSQHSKPAIESAENEMQIFKNCFNNKINFFSKNIGGNISWQEFSLTFNRSYFSYGNYLLHCEFLFKDEFYYQILTTQDLIIKFELFKKFDDNETRKPLEEEQRVFYYTSELQGWGNQHLYEQATNSELDVLFYNKDKTQFYDLIDLLQTDVLVDKWFQRLISKSTEAIERYI